MWDQLETWTELRRQEVYDDEAEKNLEPLIEWWGENGATCAKKRMQESIEVEEATTKSTFKENNLAFQDT